jgi:hypothetical protein
MTDDNDVLVVQVKERELPVGRSPIEFYGAAGYMLTSST